MLSGDPWMSRLLWTLKAGLLCCLLCGQPGGMLASARAADGYSLSAAQIGVQGRFKAGDPTAIVLDLNAPAGVSADSLLSLTVRVPDPDGQYVKYRGKVEFVSPGKLRAEALVKPGRLVSDWLVQLTDDEGELLWEQMLRGGTDVLGSGLKQSTELWITLGLTADWQALYLADLERMRTATSSASNDEIIDRNYLTLDSPAQLPWQKGALAGVDVLLLAAGQTDASGALLGTQFTEPQVEVLRDWVEFNGGHLILSLGHDPEKFLQSPLGRWLNAPLPGTTEIRQLDGFEEFAHRPARLELSSPISGLKLGEWDATTLVSGLDGPLIAQGSRGLGRVTLITVDLQLPVISKWPSFGYVVDRCVRWDRDSARQGRQESTLLARSGINDLQTQMVYGLDTFPTVQRVSLWVVMLAIGLYVLLIGPLDYWLVHRLWQRPHYTWITFPAWLTLGVVVAWALAQAWNGTVARANQWELIDFDAVGGQLRGRSWYTYYSSRTQRIALAARPTPLDGVTSQPAMQRFGWTGTAEASIGGFYRSGGVQFSRRDYDLVDSSWKNRPVAVWSTIGSQLEWSQPLEMPFDVNLESSGVGRLNGTISHQLPGTLEDCVLAFGNRAYQPVRRRGSEKVHELAPHHVWEIGGGQLLEQRELRGFLTQAFTRIVRQNDKDLKADVQVIQTPYQSSNREPGYIFRMMTFHRAAGGEQYTGLRNDLLSELDLSPHLRLGRAVLMARLKYNYSEWNAENQKVDDVNRQTFIRLILPVKQVSGHELHVLPKPDEGLK